MADWNSSQYLKFKNERTQPAIDLANRLRACNPKSIIDIGCGPGNSTAVLTEIFPEAEIIGADNSPNMLETARTKHPELKFIEFDANEDFSELNGKFDVVFSNACLQWIDNHHALLPRLMKLLKDGGSLAVQIPINDREPVHNIIKATAARSEWAGRFTYSGHNSTLPSAEYFDILSEITPEFSIWETVYFHRLQSHEAVIDWVRSTRLRPYLSALNEEEQKIFEAQLLEEIKKAYPQQKNGEIIFRFPRLFFTAVK